MTTSVDQSSSKTETRCSKHGQLSEKSVIRVTLIEEDKGLKTKEVNLFCLKCVSDLLNNFQREGLIGRVTETHTR